MQSKLSYSLWSVALEGDIIGARLQQKKHKKPFTVEGARQSDWSTSERSRMLTEHAPVAQRG